MRKEDRRKGEPKYVTNLILQCASEFRISWVLQEPNYEHRIDEAGSSHHPHFPSERLREHPR